MIVALVLGSWLLLLLGLGVLARALFEKSAPVGAAVERLRVGLHGAVTVGAWIVEVPERRAAAIGQAFEGTKLDAAKGGPGGGPLLAVQLFHGAKVVRAVDGPQQESDDLARAWVQHRAEEIAAEGGACRAYAVLFASRQKAPFATDLSSSSISAFLDDAMAVAIVPCEPTPPRTPPRVSLQWTGVLLALSLVGLVATMAALLETSSSETTPLAVASPSGAAAKPEPPSPSPCVPPPSAVPTDDASSAGEGAKPRDGAAAPKPAASPEKPPAAITGANASSTTGAKHQAAGQKASIAPGSSSKKPADPHPAGSITHVNPFSDAGTTP